MRIIEKKMALKIGISFENFKKEILRDYYIAVLSRAFSLIGRKEVLTGKAKFGIFGDGKELPQIVLSKFFRKGDWRSGYYRDQTIMFALDLLTPQQSFAGLYAHTDIEKEPLSAGRQMNGHFVTHSLNEDGSWRDLTAQYNSGCDVSCTAGQIPRIVGLGWASKLFRNEKELEKGFEKFSKKGNEICWGTIGNASTSEGHFYEAINACGVLQIPVILSVWDDDYGISVHNKHQTTKESISEALKGFQRNEKQKGIEILSVNGWDYVALIETYKKAKKLAREKHIPVLVHVKELTQPQGHSTSGSHARYKSKKRLKWEEDFDCNKKFKQWIIDFQINDDKGNTLKIVENEQTLIDIQKRAEREVKEAQRNAWLDFQKPLIKLQKEACFLLKKTAEKSSNKQFIYFLTNQLENLEEVTHKTIFSCVRKCIAFARKDDNPNKRQLLHWFKNEQKNAFEKYNSKLYNDTKNALPNVPYITPTYDEKSKLVDARLIIRDNFGALLSKYPEVFIFGEDVGKIGDVNQGLENLQNKYGKNRVSDTGIRELTIIGQAIGLALRGLRPIAEIQYLDYLLYGLQPLSDDLACLRYRSFNKQTAPLIIRTRGHRLEGIWHSGSPMSLILSSLRGMYVFVPRNMTQAAGFYNALLKSDEPAIVIEPLNGYRLKEKMPKNLANFTTPIGQVEILKPGKDITLVSYGSTLRIVQQILLELEQIGIDAEIIDVQSLIPFDLSKDIVKSIAKTNRLLIIDEDVPGGASAYILDEILQKQNAYKYLDSPPKTLSAKAHRPAYADDGDYFSKPSKEDIFEAVYEIFNEVDPKKFPSLYEI